MDWRYVSCKQINLPRAQELTSYQGPALALRLQHHNISCKIFDLRDKAAFDGGFVALAPNALRALDRIDVYDRISKQGWNYEQFQFLSSRNLSHIGTVLNGSQQKYGYKALRISRGIVRQTLLDTLGERGIELHYNSRCVNIKETERSAVVATFADGRVEEADFLIGADGIHSHVRAHIEPNAIPTFSGQLGVGGSLQRSKLPPSGQEVYMPCLILGKLNSFMVSILVLGGYVVEDMMIAVAQSHANTVRSSCHVPILATVSDASQPWRARIGLEMNGANSRTTRSHCIRPCSHTMRTRIGQRSFTMRRRTLTLTHSHYGRKSSARSSPVPMTNGSQIL